MIHSILCYMCVPPSVELLGPTTPSFLTRTYGPHSFQTRWTPLLIHYLKENQTSYQMIILIIDFVLKPYL